MNSSTAAATVALIVAVTMFVLVPPTKAKAPTVKVMSFDTKWSGSVIDSARYCHTNFPKEYFQCMLANNALI